MEEIIMKPFASTQKTATNLSTMHKDSHTISKIKPKIRIIHIFAPEIIKTDVANFRELVQRLTGKPLSSNIQKGTKKIKKQRIIPRKPDHHLPQVNNNLGFTEKMVKEENEEIKMWNGANSNGGIFAGFADLDGLIQELGEFPMLPMANMDSSSNHHLHGFGETQLV